MRLFLLLLAALPAMGFQAPPSPLIEKTRALLDQWVAGKYDDIYALFDDRMKGAITPDTYKQQSEQIKKLGPIKKIGDPVAQTQSLFPSVSIRLDFETASLNFNVVWDRSGKIAGTSFRPAVARAIPWNAPDYSDASSFTEREVSIGEDPTKLPATLTLPKSDKKVPAVVLVHGSGPNDRDESVGGAKVFKDLAQGLASRGIAVLRYEKRTKMYPLQFSADQNFTMNEETVDDAVRAAAVLRGQDGIDPARIFVLGHSQGGYMMPRILKKDPKLAGGIILAGNVRPVEELILEQTEYMMTLSGRSADEIKAQMEKVRKEPFGAARIPKSYTDDLKDYHPDAELKKIELPVLVLQGERDYQVSMKDFALWRAAIGSRSNAALRSYPKLTHLFTAGEGKPSPAEYQKPAHVDKQVIEDISSWIRSGSLLR